MDKILNIIKYNTYGLPPMINKYIFMERHNLENDMFYIYQIKSIINEIYPTKYECNRLFILNIPKDKNKKAYIYDNLIELELTNNDMLYQISIDEYLGLFKAFIEISGTTSKVQNNFFIDL